MGDAFHVLTRGLKFDRKRFAGDVKHFVPVRKLFFSVDLSFSFDRGSVTKSFALCG
jgi:hypothetical protein